MEILNDFLQKFPPTGELRKPTVSVLNRFKGRLPAEWLKLWETYGFGNYGNGLLKVINPDDYTPNLYTWLGGENTARIPILVTGFGNIIYYRQLPDAKDDVCLLNIHRCSTQTCTYSFKEFMRFITDDEVIESLLDKELFGQAVEKCGPLAENETFFFAPALAFGGDESLSYIQKGDGVTHQQLLFEMMNNSSDNEEEEDGEKDQWTEAYEANPHVFEREDGTLMVNFTLTDTVDTVLPQTPEKLYAVEGKEITLWVLIFFSYDDKKNLASLEYHTALQALQKYVVEERDDHVLLRGLNLEEMKQTIAMIDY